MAIILDQEKYQKIFLENCFINKNGVYVSVITFKNKEEREKEKQRELELNNFVLEIESKKQELNQLEEGSEEFLNLFDIIETSEYISNHLSHIAYKLQNDEHDYGIKLNEKIFSNAKLLGFKEEWAINPVIIISKEIFRVGDYEKQDFNLETFYPMLKDYWYKDGNGGYITTDDL
jgi:hypothetical protein